jgi:hypothetical protein
VKLWVDDIRTPPEGWWWAKDSDKAIEWLICCKNLWGPPEIMSLDHDLGGDDTTRPIVLWCCENEFWPTEVIVHSANPVGRDWLEGMIKRYKP